MTLLLLFIATILLLSVLLSKLSTHVGIPVLLAFLFLGMLFGSDGLAQISFENYDFANQISTVALLSIIFYGGFGTNWKAARRVALPSILLSTLGSDAPILGASMQAIEAFFEILSMHG